MRNFLSLLFLITLYIYTSTPSFSQDFEIAPTLINFDCEPGQVETKTITIQNHADQKQQFVFVISDVSYDSLGNQIKTNEKTAHETSCKDWLSITPSFLDLNPNEHKEARVSIQVPSTQSATRWAKIYVSPTTEQTSIAADKQMSTGITVKPRISIRVTQSPRSNTNYKGSIGNLSEITQTKDTVRTFQAKVRNTGQKVLDAKIYWVLSNLQTAKEIKLKPERISVLPGNVHMVKRSLSLKINPGKYSLAAILDYGNNTTLEAVQMNVEVK